MHVGEWRPHFYIHHMLRCILMEMRKISLIQRNTLGLLVAMIVVHPTRNLLVTRVMFYPLDHAFSGHLLTLLSSYSQAYLFSVIRYN